MSTINFVKKKQKNKCVRKENVYLERPPPNVRYTELARPAGG